MLAASFCVFLVGATFVQSASLKDSGLPKAGCEDVSGKVCIPDACSKKTCNVKPNAVCIADRCGCEARYFELSTVDNQYHDVTKDCRHKNVTELSFAGITFTQSDAEAIAKDPEMTLKVFRVLNGLTSDSLYTLATFLKQMSTVNPTDDNIHNFKTALDKLKELLKDGNTMDEMIATTDKTGTTDKMDERKLPGVLGLLGTIIGLATNHDEDMMADYAVDDVPASLASGTASLTGAANQQQAPMLIMDEDTHQVMAVPTSLTGAIEERKGGKIDWKKVLSTGAQVLGGVLGAVLDEAPLVEGATDKTDANWKQFVSTVVKVLPQIKDVGSQIVEAIKNNTASDEKAEVGFPIKSTLEAADDMVKFLTEKAAPIKPVKCEDKSKSCIKNKPSIKPPTKPSVKPSKKN